MVELQQYTNEAMSQQEERFINVKDAGAKGGRTTLERHGREFYQIIGKKGGNRARELYRDLLKEFGRKGGRPRRPA